MTARERVAPKRLTGGGVGAGGSWDSGRAAIEPAQTHYGQVRARASEGMRELRVPEPGGSSDSTA